MKCKKCGEWRKAILSKIKLYKKMPKDYSGSELNSQPMLNLGD